jgi:hypothetical protein
MRQVGLAGKPTATVASDELLEELRVLAHELGRYPHEKLDLEPGPRKPGRMVKGSCPDCGTILYGSRTAWDNALPECGVCGTPYTVEPSPEQAAHWGLAPADEVEPLENVSTTVELKTTDGRFTLRSTKVGKREGSWLVTDHQAVEVAARRVMQTDENPLGVLVTEYAERWTARADRADALGFIAALRSGALTWDDVADEADDDDFEDEDVDLDDEDVWGKLGEWDDDPDGDHLGEDEDEEPDYEDGRIAPEEEADYERLTAYREEAGRRTSEKIASGDEEAMD